MNSIISHFPPILLMNFCDYVYYKLIYKAQDQGLHEFIPPLIDPRLLFPSNKSYLPLTSNFDFQHVETHHHQQAS